MTPQEQDALQEARQELLHIRRALEAHRESEERRHAEALEAAEEAKRTPEERQRLLGEAFGYGVHAIGVERMRQIAKGFTFEHDAEHDDRALIVNAMDTLCSYMSANYDPPAGADAWGIGRRHHDNPIKLLAVAGALIAAEHDRIARAVELGAVPKPLEAPQ